MKKLVALLLSAVMVFGLCACDSEGSTGATGGTVDKDAVSTIKAAAKKLNDTYSNYIISNAIESSYGASEFIECVKGEDIYTDYSVDSEGNIGTSSYGSADTIQYALSDWTHDGKYYSFSVDESGNDLMYVFPSTFATKYNHDREFLWVNRMLEQATSVKKVDSLTLTLDGVEEQFTAYEIEIPSDLVAELLNTDTLGVYKSLKDDEKSGSNIDKFCDFYLQDINRVIAYTPGKATVAIDSNGILKFMSLETGGLGSLMYVTKAVVDVRNQNVRDTPDFTGAIPIASTLTEIADFVAQYPDYDSAMRALSELSDTGAYDDLLGEGVDELIEPDGEGSEDDVGSIEGGGSAES